MVSRNPFPASQRTLPAPEKFVNVYPTRGLLLVNLLEVKVERPPTTAEQVEVICAMAAAISVEGLWTQRAEYFGVTELAQAMQNGAK
jgi:hypothetical protein